MGSDKIAQYNQPKNTQCQYKTHSAPQIITTNNHLPLLYLPLNPIHRDLPPLTIPRYHTKIIITTLLPLRNFNPNYHSILSFWVSMIDPSMLSKPHSQLICEGAILPSDFQMKSHVSC